MDLGIIFKVTGIPGNPNRIFIDDHRLRREKLPNGVSSAKGFDWGIAGDGTDQTAFSILLQVFGSRKIAKKYYKDFAEGFVAVWPHKERFDAKVDVTDLALDHTDPTKKEFPLLPIGRALLEVKGSK